MQDRALLIDELGPRHEVVAAGFNPDSLAHDEFLLCPCGQVALGFNAKAKKFDAQGGAHDATCYHGIADRYGQRGAIIWDALIKGKTIITKIKSNLVPRLRTKRKYNETKQLKKSLGEHGYYSGFTVCTSRDMRLLIEIQRHYEQTFLGQKADIRCDVQGILRPLGRLSIGDTQDNNIREMMNDVMQRSSREVPEKGLLSIKRMPYLFSMLFQQIQPSEITKPHCEDVGFLDDLSGGMLDRLYASPIIQIGALGHSCFVYNHNAKTKRHLPFHGFQIVIHSQGNGAIEKFMNDAIIKGSSVDILSGFFERNMRSKIYAFQQPNNNQYARDRLSNGARNGVLVLHLYPENIRQFSLANSYDIIKPKPDIYPDRRCK